MPYVPEPIADEPTMPQLVSYLLRELQRISIEIETITDGRFLPILYAAPGRPREGMLAVADGTSWNPGSGKGLYEYRTGAWAKL